VAIHFESRTNNKTFGFMKEFGYVVRTNTGTATNFGLRIADFGIKRMSFGLFDVGGARWFTSYAAGDITQSAPMNSTVSAIFVEGDEKIKDANKRSLQLLSLK
jgi:hypothetical protein